MSKMSEKMPDVGFLTAQSHFRQQVSGKLLSVLCLWAQKDNISEKSRIIRCRLLAFSALSEKTANRFSCRPAEMLYIF